MKYSTNSNTKKILYYFLSILGNLRQGEGYMAGPLGTVLTGVLWGGIRVHGIILFLQKKQNPWSIW